MPSRRQAPPPTRLTSLLVACALLTSSLGAPPAHSAAGEAAVKVSSPVPAARPIAKSAPRGQGGAAYRAGQLLVRFSDGVAESEREAVAVAEGATRRVLRGGSGVELWVLAAGREVESAAVVLSARRPVEYAEPNYVITADQLTSSDPRLPEQWALRNTGQSGGEPSSDIGVLRAWAKTTGSPRTVVAVVDSGIDFSHPDLANNRWANPADPANGRDDDGDGRADDVPGWDWVNNSGEMRDPAGHGTAVAGLIAAEGDNGVGTAGVMWRASLMSLRVLDEQGTGDIASAIEAIDYASSHGAHVINCSWGASAESRSLSEAVSRAGARGALVVASAGNDGRNIDASPRYPAAYDLPNVVSVAATNNFDQLTPWSNWGAGRAHVAAPGTDLLTAAPGGGYRVVSGTSASAALVTGVVGLVKTLRPGLAPARVREAVVRGARPAAGLSGRLLAGGVVSASGAVGMLDAMPLGEGEGEGESAEGTAGKKEKERGGDGPGVASPAADDPASTSAGAASARGLRGRPATNLPDLDAARRHLPRRPRAPAPVPSTLRNCPPRNPRCNGGASATSPPTPSQTSSKSNAAEPIFVAAAGYRLPRLGVASDISLVDYIGQMAGTPDTGAEPYLLLPRLYARATGLLPTLFPAAVQTGNGAAFVSQSVPATMSAGETYNVWVKMKNTGSTTWRPEEFYRLGAQSATGTDWRLGRVQLPRSVRPASEVGDDEATVTVPFTVTAPTAASPPAGYSFRWQMVRDGHEWFGPLTPDTRVAVTAPAFAGEFELANCSEIRGWAWDSRRPTTPIEVDVFKVDASGSETFLARVVADQHRPGQGRGDDRHGFSLVPPAELRTPGTHTVRVRYANTEFLPQSLPPLSDAPGSLSPKTVSGCAALPNATAPPASLLTVQAADSMIKVSWTPAAGAAHYRVERATTKSGPFNLAGSVAAPASSYEDHGRTRGVSYLYRVCASDSAGQVCVSPYSNVALGTAYSFFEPQLTAQVTTVKAQHFTELRQTVGAARAAAELPAASWGEAIAPGGLVRAAHVRELRARLAEALSALNILPPSYTDPALTEQVTVIKRAHVEELRLRSTLASGTVSNQSAQSNAQAAAARLDAQNRTGGGGVDLLSGNFNWSLPLVSLRGRAGLDLGLSLSYNSLVWTKQGATVHFNADEGYPAPGFRLGFPVIQPQYYDPQTGRNAYLLVTPAGARVELRQVAGTYDYESVDSSYLLLRDGGGGLLQLWSPSGERLTFFRHGHSHYVSEVRDRNGNRITASHDSQGRLLSVTDTLSRTINFNYDANQNLLSITQQRGGQTHTWATFGYGVATIGGNAFAGAVTTQGAEEGQAVNVLTQVGLADGSSYHFEYNAYAQVAKVSRYSADDHQLAYTSYDYQTVTDDCPRVEARREWALDWNNGQEAVTTYAPAVGGDWGQVVAPDGTRYRERFHSAQTNAWKKGLVIETETYAGGIRQKWSALGWTQDDETLGYKKNPRVTENNIYDAENNRRRTRTTHHAAFGLVKDVFEYASDATTVLRRTSLEYNLDSAYLDARLIGLVGAKYVYEGGDDVNGGGVLRSKVTFGYDETSEGRFVPTSTAATPTQHDSAYAVVDPNDPGFRRRGNLTSATRWSVSSPALQGEPLSVESKLGYNTTGSVVFTTDPEGHKSLLSYADRFSDEANRNTFAYPTAATDPDQAVVEPESERKRSLTTYRYETGAVTRTVGVSPNAGQSPPEQAFEYDAAGRLTRATNLVTNAYKRYVYSPGQTWVQSFSTVKDLNTEAYSVEVMDGAGRVYASAIDHPGSAGRYSGQHTVYDALGRATRSSNPIEITTGWEPAGDDAAIGWLYSEQDYDWMGRPTYSRHVDGGMDKELIYGGCGCAGGEVTTVRDAVGRRQKLYKDSLGRTVREESYEGNVVYSAMTVAYNALDQVTRMREYAGPAPAPGSEPTAVDWSPAVGGVKYQTSLFEYDGHARLARSHAPAQRDQNDVIKWVTYAYDEDDVLRSVVDPRGVVTAFGFANNRHLVSSVAYSNAPQGMPVPSPAAYTYDAAGNRTSMEDGTGRTDYHYDQLSRLTSEARQFSGITSRTYTLTYSYNPGGQLTGVTDPFGSAVGYNRDATGRLASVSATGYAGVSQFASNIQYRAWGSVKAMTYGNGAGVTVGYDARLRVSSYATPSVGMQKAYEYHPDGRLAMARNPAAGDNSFDRSYAYDHAGRLVAAHTGVQAHGGTAPGGPYQQTYTYDAFGNNTGGTSQHWSTTHSRADSYANQRRADFEYDASGNVTYDKIRRYVYDAANQMSSFNSGVQSYTHDGDGRLARVSRLNGAGTPDLTYYLRSSALGGRVVSVLTPSGNAPDARTDLIYGGEAVLAQRMTGVSGFEQVTWEHRDPAGTTVVRTGASGMIEPPVTELDPVGASVGSENPALLEEPPPAPDETSPEYPVYGNPTRPGGMGCHVQFMPVMCEYFLALISERPNGMRVVSVSMEPVGRWTDGYGTHTHPRDSDLLTVNTIHHQSRVFEVTGIRELVTVSWLPGVATHRLVPVAATASQAQPCDVAVPKDESERAVIATLLGEASTPGEGSWGPDEYGPEAYSKPSGTLTHDDVWGEMSYMIAVINNRLIDWGPKQGYKNWKDVVTTQHRNEKGELEYDFLGYPNGQDILNELGNNGDTNCERARLAVSALTTFKDTPIRNLPRYYYWKGIKQRGKKTKKWIIVMREGAFRWANTDFMVKER